MKHKKWRFITIVSFVLILNLPSNSNVSLKSHLMQPVFAEAVKAKAVSQNAKAKQNKVNDSITSEKSKLVPPKKNLVDNIIRFLPLTIGIAFFLFLLKVIKKAISSEKNEKIKSETIVYEDNPSNVSDAVCSFVKHRIKFK